MEENLISRADILIQQNRYAEADEILSNLLSKDPTNSWLLAKCSEVALELKDLERAESLINNAIGLTPYEDSFYYVKARLFVIKKKYDKAEEYLNEAIKINPDEADYFAVWASIKLFRKQYEKGLELANKALALDAENILGLNTRSTALLKLNRNAESSATIENALEEDPNNAYTHANRGWILLELGSNKEALHHFMEALKNDPNLALAQAGMVEALKAKYFVYRLFLRYSFWMSNLTAKYQWGVIIGLYVSVRGLEYIANNSATFRPFLMPVIILLGLIAFSTWVINPIGNLFLRLNVYGKHLLDRKEILSSNFVGISVLVFLTGLLLYAFSGDYRWFAIIGFGFTMMVPLSTMFATAKYKHSLLIYTILMFLIGMASVLITFATGALINRFTTFYIFGFIGFQWVANFLLIREDNV
jgi:tetratricopeptide (TPR) repeat protein